MDKGWSEKNKEMQTLLGKESTYKDGIRVLLELRKDLFGQITNIVENYPDEVFAEMPFRGAKGFHSKTLSYSIWHVFRIEDIVAHEMIAGDEQILFSGNFGSKIGTACITTGNEFVGEDIREFSEQLNVSELYAYAQAVMESSDKILLELDYKTLRRKFSQEDRKRLEESGCVSTSPEAWWLIDYWCGKDVRGLLKMPFSRHWIMHIEAMLRIKNQLCKEARKG